MKTTAEVVRVKQAMAWIEGQAQIHLTAVSPGGKPVVLSAQETRSFAKHLSRLADILEAIEQSPDQN